ncbi:MAG: SPASM domain-containing protein [Solobacterium sp.]|nr:SPASM domain-containing protein [Solobacterium sp.]
MKRVYIEITNRCNLHCSFCKEGKKPRKEMHQNEWQLAIDEALTITPYLYLHVQGEPLLHTQFEDILTYCDQKECHIQLVTNGTYLNRYPNLFAHPSLRKLSISLQSIEYQHMDIEEYTNTILSYCKAFPKDKNQYMELRFWREDQLKEKKTAYLFQKIKEAYPFHPTNRKNSFVLDTHLYLSYANSFSWPTINTKESTQKGTCLGALEQIAILADGTVSACCLDIDGYNAFGNIFDSSLSSILQSQYYQDFCEALKNNQLISPLCQKCTFNHRFSKDK